MQLFWKTLSTLQVSWIVEPATSLQALYVLVVVFIGNPWHVAIDPLLEAVQLLVKGGIQSQMNAVPLVRQFE